MNLKQIENKVNKIYKYIAYPLEFIVSLICILYIYQLYCIKTYNNFYDKSTLAIDFIYGICFLIIVLLNLIKSKKEAKKIYLTFAIPIGIAYIIFMLPSSTPDASSHLWKAYNLSTGNIIVKVDEQGNSNFTVPEDLLIYNEERLISYDTYNKLLSTKTQYDNIASVDSPNKGSSNIYYIFYALGIAIGNKVFKNVFIRLFLGRILNYIIIMIIGYFAIDKIPFGKILLGIYMLMPMYVHMATAINLDALMNIIIIFWLSYTLYLAFEKSKLTKKQIITFLVASFFMSIIKVTYLPMLLIAFLIPIKRKDITKKEKISITTIAIVLVLVGYICHSVFSNGLTSNASYYYMQNNNIDQTEQIKYLLTNPTHIFKLIWSDFKTNADKYLFSFIGQQMGWFNINTLYFWSVFYLVILIASIFIEDNKVVFNKREKIFSLILSFGMYLLVILGLYFGWTNIGALVVAGVQGRYFIPITILVLLTLCLKNNYIKTKNGIYIVYLATFFINIMFVVNIMNYFLV